MQAYVEIMLVAILVVVLFQPPLALSDLAKSVLGKALFVLFVIVLAHQFGKNAGLLAAMITIVLLNHTREGFFEEIINQIKPLGSAPVGSLSIVHVILILILQNVQKHFLQQVSTVLLPFL